MASRRWMATRATAVVAGVAVLSGIGIAFPERQPVRVEVAVDAVTTTSPVDDVVAAVETTTTSTTTTTTTLFDGWVDPRSVGLPYGTTVEGLLTFRGNPTRSYHGSGPIPQNPEILWTFPADGSLCSLSSVGGTATEWCGTGWTGQPAMFERDGTTWVAFGSYDAAVHFLDASTGERLLPDFPVGDIIKGSVTVDPDGYPLLYTGARDNELRVIAFDRDEPVELWSLNADAVSPTKWNNDWDGSPLVIDDHLFEGGENSQIHIVRLHRSYGPDGLVTVAPELVFNAPGWDAELIAAVGNNVSIENSVAIHENTLYFANSGGLVQGWDIAGLRDGITPERTFRYWAGDDIDASIVFDDEGMLYVGVEYERLNSRSRELGQVLKLDPTRPDDPLVWGVDARGGPDTGVWATPAIHRDLVIVATMDQGVIAFDRETGEQRWVLPLGWHLWQSPVIVDDTMIIGDCEGRLRAYDVGDTSRRPVEMWRIDLAGCIESTPAVWDGLIVVGTRGGKVYAIGDR